MRPEPVARPIFGVHHLSEGCQVTDTERSARTILLFALFVFSASCTKPDPNQIERRGADGVREAVSIVPEPLPAPYQLIEDLVIGVEYGDEGEMLRFPLDFIVLEDGTHVILDNSPLQIRIFNADGSFRRAFGQQGSGPNDLRQYRRSQGSSIKTVETGGIEVWTGWPTFSQIWTVNGDMVSSETLNNSHQFRKGQRPRRFFARGDKIFGQLMTFGTPRVGYMDRIAHIVVTDWEGSSVDTFLTITHADMPDNIGLFLEITGIIPLDQILATSTGRMYVSSFEEDWIREFDLDSGRELLRFKWEHEPDSFAGGRLESFRDGQYDIEIENGFNWFKERVSIMYLAEGLNSEIWVQRIERAPPLGRVSILTFPGEGTWPTDIFSSGGAYMGRMDLPYPARTQKIFGEYIYAIVFRGEGIPTLTRYRLEPADGVEE